MLKLIQDNFSEFSMELKQINMQHGYASVEKETDPKWYVFYSEEELKNICEDEETTLGKLIKRDGLIEAVCYTIEKVD